MTEPPRYPPHILFLLDSAALEKAVKGLLMAPGLGNETNMGSLARTEREKEKSVSSQSKAGRANRKEDEREGGKKKE